MFCLGQRESKILLGKIKLEVLLSHASGDDLQSNRPWTRARETAHTRVDCGAPRAQVPAPEHGVTGSWQASEGQVNEQPTH